MQFGYHNSSPLRKLPFLLRSSDISIANTKNCWMILTLPKFNKATEPEPEQMVLVETVDNRLQVPY